MSEPLAADAPWSAIAPLLPPEPPRPKGGCPRCDDGSVLAGILFVLRSGTAWRLLLHQFGCSGMMCWRRLRDWHAAGVWARLHRALLGQLNDAGALD